MREFRSDELIDREATIHIFRNASDTPEEPHTHDFIEIVYILRGSATQTVNSESYEARHGDLIFINYGSTHSFAPHGEFTMVNICFDPETVGSGMITPENAFALLQLTAFEELRRDNDEGMISFSGAERDELESLLGQMLREYSERSPSWQILLKSYMNVLIVKLLRKTYSGGIMESLPDIWRELSDYIDQNLGADLTLSTLARKCFYNPSYFSRIFKERFGLSPTEYINRKRVEYAARLINEGKLTHEAIAEMAGFSSKSSFYRTFARVTGMSVSEYRRGGASK